MTRNRLLALLAALVCGSASAADPDSAPAVEVSATGSYYAMRDQPDFTVVVASAQFARFRLESRYNYEARYSTSVFAGWRFAGGDEVEWNATPLLGGLFGQTTGIVPGLEASVGWRSLDAYVEAEYVGVRGDASARYWYAWSELGWRPVDWLRVGLAGQRTRLVDNGRELQRGLFAQVTARGVTLSVYGFNPEAASRYAIVALGVSL